MKLRVLISLAGLSGLVAAGAAFKPMPAPPEESIASDSAYHYWVDTYGWEYCGGPCGGGLCCIIKIMPGV